ncbi:MAG TPA: urease accessory protein UreD [Acidimicrobiales bacterium]|nr:urease accessory protein UreD [Acidimicrobiales bacterium]
MSDEVDSRSAPGTDWSAGLAGRVDVALDAGPGGAARLTRLRCSGALAARPTPAGLYLLATAAHPVGDDASRIDLTLGPGASGVVRSTGATLARRGATGGSSTAAVRATLADRATLCWLVEPGIAAGGASHVATSTVRLAPSARLAWREEVVLGRHADPCPGSWRSRLEIRRDGAPLLVTDLGLGPGSPAWASASVLGGARVLSSLVLVDPGLPADVWAELTARAPGAKGAAFALAGPGVELMAWGEELGACRAIVARLLDDVELRWLPRDAVQSGPDARRG